MPQGTMCEPAIVTSTQPTRPRTQSGALPVGSLVKILPTTGMAGWWGCGEKGGTGEYAARA